MVTRTHNLYTIGSGTLTTWDIPLRQKLFSIKKFNTLNIKENDINYVSHKIYYLYQFRYIFDLNIVHKTCRGEID